MWFSGPVANAVTEAKQQRHILLVFVHDDSTDSNDMAESWADTDVEQLCKDEQFVCLDIEAQSENFKFFSTYYPVVTFPMSFFIGPNGKPIEILTGAQSPAHLLGKIREVSQAHKTQMAQSPKPKSSPVAPTQPSTSHNSATGQLPLDEKVEKAKELLAAQRALKAKQLEEEEREKEIQRRQLGKELSDLKQKQKDAEIQELADARRKTKQADKEALRKIREQIEADRRDKAAKFGEHKAAEDSKKQDEERKIRDAKAAQEAAENAAKSSHSRIQFRIPTMPVINERFAADDRLEVLYSFVAQNVPFTDFALIQMYPRREFTASDRQKSLRDLELVPSSVMLVVPPPSVGGPVVKSASGGINTLVQWLLYPLTLVYSVVIGLFFGGTGNRRAVRSDESSSPTRPNATAAGRGGSKEAQRSTGQMGRLSDLQPDADDTATWNGNSTQQL